MHAASVAVDLAKSVFQLAVADDQWRVTKTQRLTHTQYVRAYVQRNKTDSTYTLATKLTRLLMKQHG